MSAAPINDGGPEFPCEWDYIGTNRAAANGMSLRDYFAGQAMQGWLSSYPRDMEAERAKLGAFVIADFAYAIADAMLAERAKATGGAE